MSGIARAGVAGWVLKRAARMRFPTLTLLAGLVLLADLVFPDALPFVDELLLGLGTLILGSLRRRREDPAGGPGGAPRS